MTAGTSTGSERLSPDARTVLEQRLARLAATAGRGSRPVIPRGRGPRPVSPAQQRMLFLEELDPGRPTYHVIFNLRLDGPLDAGALESALRGIEERHEILRTVYRTDGADYTQVTGDARLHLRRLERPGATEADLDALARDEHARPFDLAAGPVWRAALARTGPDRHHLVLTLHHIAFDGWSVDVLARELAAGYATALGTGPAPAAPPVQYADFAAWQRRRLDDGGYDDQLTYWTDRLAGAPQRLELPSFGPVAQEGGAVVRARVDPALTAAVRELARGRAATPFMVLLAALHALLHRYSGERDVLVGTPVANRAQPEVEGLIGLFVNTVAVRAEVRPGAPFADLLARVRAAAAAAQAHQDVPFERVVAALPVPRDTQTSPLFRVLFDWNSSAARTGTALRLGTATATLVERFRPQTAKFDVSLAVAEHADAFELELEYRRDLWDAAGAERVLGHYLTLLRAAAAAPATPVGDLPLLGPAETALLRTGWQGPVRALTGPHDITAAIAARAGSDDVALVSGADRVTYRELNARVDRLAGHLRAAGAEPDRPIGVLLHRGVDLVIAIVAVVRAGAPYLPLDPEHPAERTRTVLRDAGAALVVTGAALTDRLAGTETVVRLDADAAAIAARPPRVPAAAIRPEHLAYVFYTSGSTGRPKGVMVSHRAAGNQLAWQIERFGLGPGAAVLFKTNVTFDDSVVELFATLNAGARLVIAAPGGHRDPAYLRGLLAAERISYVRFVPTMLAALLAHGGDTPLPHLRVIKSAGEALSPEVRARCLASLGAELYNAYGPTETAVNVTADRCRLDGDPRVPIGAPTTNVRCYVLDAEHRLQPIGVPGELCIGGVQLARGYLGRPGLTADRFVPDPFGPPGSRLYRTGDLVRWRADGRLDFLGRLDRQVKLRGFRVELGEIEAVLAERAGPAAVVARTDGPGGPRLVAYVAGPGADPAGLREWLRTRLPEYMVPAVVVNLPELPQLSSGKVDYKRLPDPPHTAPVAAEYAAARTPVEQTLADLWGEVLGVARVGRDDDFFALGGHSMLAVQLLSRVRDTLEVDVPLRWAFDAPTPAGFAARLAARSAGPGSALPPVPAAGGPVPQLSAAEAGLWLVDQLAPGDPAYVVPVVSRLSGPLDPAALLTALRTLPARHEALRTTFPARDGVPHRVVRPALDLAVDHHDLRAEPEPQRAATRERLVRAVTDTPFDLARSPLVRGALLTVADDEHVLALAFHHAVVDAWSLAVLHDDLVAAYDAAVTGRPGPTGPAPRTASDYAGWQRGLERCERFELELAHWRDRLAGLPPGPELPADRPRPARPGPSAAGPSGSAHAFTVPPDVAAAVRELAAAERATPFMVLLAAYAALLQRLGGRADVVLAMPVADRARPELERVVGLLLNTVLLRVRVRPAGSFRELLRAVRAAVLDAYEHRQVPFARVVEHLGLDAAALSRYTVTIDQPPPAATLSGGVVLRPAPFVPAAAKAELNVAFEDGPDGLGGSLVYQTARFDPATIARTAGHLLRLLGAAVSAPGTRVERLDLLTAQQRADLLGPPDEPGPAEALHTLVLRQARRRPDATALVAGGTTVTYRELAERTERLAGRLHAHGVRPDDVVALALGRGPAQPVAVLAVLRLGAAYVALDRRHPAARHRQILADSGARCVVTDRGGDWPLPAVAVAGGAEHPAPPIVEAPDAVAYIAYTSGSTGTPKGVLTRHRAAAAYLTRYVIPVHGLGPHDTVLQLPALAFDASVRDLLGPLAAGARVVLVDDDAAADPAALLAAIDSEGVTALLSVVPTVLRALLAEAAPGSGAKLCRILTAGEVLDHRDAARAAAVFAGRPVVVNQYGPTETTMTATWHRVATVPGATGPAPIGRPAPGVRAWVVDRGGEPAPPGVPGELWIGGDRVALGYHGRPALTAERFVPDPFSGTPGARVYRTGDTAYRDTDGTLHFVGRDDDQVKIRGNRVEPAEVEAALRDGPGVREAAVVVAGPPGAPRLAGFVAPADADLAALRAVLAERLPEYLVPATLHALPALPRTSNQKVDRAALAARAATGEPAAPGGADAPRTAAERRVAAVFDELLAGEGIGGPACGRDDDFFARGGHSLLAARLASRLGVPLRTVFERRTVAALAAAADGDGPAPCGPGRSAPADSGRLTPAQLFMVRHQAADPRSPMYNISFSALLRGPLDEVALVRAADAVAARHPALRTRFADRGGEPVAVVDPVRPPEIVRCQAPTAEAATAVATAELRRPFDLAAGPPLRIALVRLHRHEHLLAVTAHHAVADGWSLSVIQSDLAAYYAAFAEGRAVTLPPVRGFAPQHGEPGPADRAFWADRLRGVPVDVAAAPDRPRPPQWSTAGAVHHFDLPPALADAVRATAAASGATAFMVLFAAVQRWLGRQTGSERFLVAVPVADRPADTEHEVGPYANILPVRADLTGAPDFGTLVARVRTEMLAAWEHQHTPFETLAEEYGGGLHPPLCRFMFAMQNLPPGGDPLPGLAVERVDLDRGTCRYDLHVRCRETADGISGWIEYSTALFDRATVAARLEDLFAVLAGAV
ncbi:non-ribosomal peptide synthetase [Dactylosporangium matsuzakiense]|uniref:non-ribosomal peptide synthetase n=2 Tax=Dactylosporangium matsuzakiense TaxID=53360 RepID=UPI0021C46C8C|nr:non-ribosomal peptide synthetase [Dactylosporangium matsuzakiense]UWZ41206.1 amino acid adenylation domain-containing protein [Dactylosporangium matsuzakiense]